MHGITQQYAHYHGGRYKDPGPIGIVLHRTYTKRGWKSAYRIGLTGDGERHVSFHFLIGKLPGYVVQFVDTDYVAWHAKGGNKKYLGIEFESLNNHDPLTPGMWVLVKKNSFWSASCENGMIPIPFFGGWSHGSYPFPYTTFSASCGDRRQAPRRASPTRPTGRARTLRHPLLRLRQGALQVPPR
jgi:hypothetical protein